jgi:hypothetical protein
MPRGPKGEKRPPTSLVATIKLRRDLAGKCFS